MDFPDDLPGMLEYRMTSGIVLTALPRRPVETVGSSGRNTAPIVKPTIPHGANAWRRATETEWRPLSTLPAAWLPFLNRQRGTVMDPRPRVDVPVAGDAFRDEVD